ncbi:MAG TPA: RES family NAD+ phosphorylase [Mycobacterium sp.]|nr:RES family NAD+ phosphorylase [Mycobacterium sp.]HUH67872.1 RES family NAD+ phosphorylase [Mycobacterium sp.]
MAIHDPVLLDQIERLGTQRFEGHVWRHMFNDHPPELSNTRGARWNPPGVAAIYTSLAPATALAEARHAIDIQPVRPKPRRRVLYELLITLDSAVDLTTERYKEVGLTELDLGADDFSPCQRVGGAVAWLGYDGIIVPSARANGGNVVILVDSVAPDALFQRVGETEIEV